MTAFVSHPHQQIAIEHIIKNPRCALWIPMGLGKTSATLTALELLTLTEQVYPALIIAPLRVANTTWPDEVRKWEHTKHLWVSKILGAPAYRKAAVKRPADLYTINPENLPWLITYLGTEWPFKTIVFDESSRLAGFRLRQGTQRAKLLAKVAFRSKRFIELTGTPASNGLSKLWGQAWFLDQGARLGRTYTAFMTRWFKQSYDGFSWEPMPHAQKEIEERIKDLCLSIRAEEYFPTEEPIKTIVPVRLDPHTQRQYKELEKQMFVDLGKHQIEPLTAAAKTNKCLQFASGCVYTDDKHNYVEVHREKITALESIIEEANGAPVLVAYNFVSDLERLLKHFPKAKVLDKNPKTIADWNAGKIPILIAHPASAGHGISLQDGGNILVYYGINWNLEEHEQIAQRLGAARQKQSGHDRPVFYYYILSENTIDFDVYKRLESKRSIQDILLEAMAKRDVETN